MLQPARSCDRFRCFTLRLIISSFKHWVFRFYPGLTWQCASSKSIRSFNWYIVTTSTSCWQRAWIQHVICFNYLLLLGQGICMHYAFQNLSLVIQLLFLEFFNFSLFIVWKITNFRISMKVKLSNFQIKHDLVLPFLYNFHNSQENVLNDVQNSSSGAVTCAGNRTRTHLDNLFILSCLKRTNVVLILLQL